MSTLIFQKLEMTKPQKKTSTDKDSSIGIMIFTMVTIESMSEPNVSAALARSGIKNAIDTIILCLIIVIIRN